ncbi:hypothetical protein A3G63_03510 [Candidatus Kaiserbacteria bacterium RIFCSPLOWO2_12_FULL_52_8]|uniref:Uncharacterized protein n=1 Tax=Candidatus Kaiserbacteria bacterium RIFCSPHIGHO2_01_FULL_53_31 TaxID=1798481 RepID=A0A1F6CH32_9BACT|nr:MAG: hypothetical protein A2678_00170 [Candidatus Kaiserbacteria bacterium RIFCSPHIGHO2_01_FULL_53_31]OGG92820.1 MAG: hypothetical protein A3G63_03510 [Candidatus Kaiserbacteria bacterium RIFCSPLOWO2_12_FULL_52_8]
MSEHLVETHADTVDHASYVNKFTELTERIYKSAATSETEETPIPRATALDVRALLIELKKYLQRAGIKDTAP